MSLLFSFLSGWISISTKPLRGSYIQPLPKKIFVEKHRQAPTHKNHNNTNVLYEIIQTANIKILRLINEDRALHDVKHTNIIQSKTQNKRKEKRVFFYNKFQSLELFHNLCSNCNHQTLQNDLVIKQAIVYCCIRCTLQNQSKCKIN